MPSINVYLADQNPERDRSLGISNMTLLLFDLLQKTQAHKLRAIISSSSIKPSIDCVEESRIPFRTDKIAGRILCDHLHSFWKIPAADIWYYPKGYLPFFTIPGRRYVVTIHDTIVQFYADHYPEYRSCLDYSYWIWMMKHTLRRADLVLTISEHARQQILNFCARYGIEPPPLKVTFECSDFEARLQQPVTNKSNTYLHLASEAPHKQTFRIVELWQTLHAELTDPPVLHLVGRLPEACSQIVNGNSLFKVSDPVSRDSLADLMHHSRALVLASEIEGFGLPALESWYVGTPVAYVHSTAVAEILGRASAPGEFSLGSPESLESALIALDGLSVSRLKQIQLQLLEIYGWEAVCTKISAALDTLM